MNRKILGAVFLVVAFFAFVIMYVGSHGHIMFRPHMGQDWFFWGAISLFTSIGLILLFGQGESKKS